MKSTSPLIRLRICMRTPMARVCLAVLCVGVTTVSPLALAQGEPEPAKQPEGLPHGYLLREEDTSPDGRYGVLYADAAVIPTEKARNQLVSLQPVKVLAETHGPVFYGPNVGQYEMAVDWARDNQAALALVGHRWGTIGATLFTLHEGKVIHRIDLMAEVQRALEAKMPPEKTNLTSRKFFITDEDEWEFSEDGNELRIHVSVNTAPNLAPGLQWAGTLRGVWSVPDARWSTLKTTGKLYRNEP